MDILQESLQKRQEWGGKIEVIINNVSAFPGIFRSVFDCRSAVITKRFRASM